MDFEQMTYSQKLAYHLRQAQDSINAAFYLTTDGNQLEDNLCQLMKQFWKGEFAQALDSVVYDKEMHPMEEENIDQEWLIVVVAANREQYLTDCFHQLHLRVKERVMVTETEIHVTLPAKPEGSTIGKIIDLLTEKEPVTGIALSFEIDPTMEPDGYNLECILREPLFSMMVKELVESKIILHNSSHLTPFPQSEQPEKEPEVMQPSSPRRLIFHVTIEKGYATTFEIDVPDIQYSYPHNAADEALALVQQAQGTIIKHEPFLRPTIEEIEPNPRKSDTDQIIKNYGFDGDREDEDDEDFPSELNGDVESTQADKEELENAWTALKAMEESENQELFGSCAPVMVDALKLLIKTRTLTYTSGDLAWLEKTITEHAERKANRAPNKAIHIQKNRLNRDVTLAQNHHRITWCSESFENPYTITSVSRADLVEAGYPKEAVMALTGFQMDELALWMAEDYCQQLFWQHLTYYVEDRLGLVKVDKYSEDDEITAEEYDEVRKEQDAVIAKQNGKKKGRRDYGDEKTDSANAALIILSESLLVRDLFGDCAEIVKDALETLIEMREEQNELQIQDEGWPEDEDNDEDDDNEDYTDGPIDEDEHSQDDKDDEEADELQRIIAHDVNVLARRGYQIVGPNAPVAPPAPYLARNPRPEVSQNVHMNIGLAKTGFGRCVEYLRLLEYLHEGTSENGHTCDGRPHEGCFNCLSYYMAAHHMLDLLDRMGTLALTLFDVPGREIDLVEAIELHAWATHRIDRAPLQNREVPHV